MLWTLCFATAWIFSFADPIFGPCCYKKTVGDVSYTLINDDDSTTLSYRCLSNCVYEADNKPGSMFCFARGDLPVKCQARKFDKKASEKIICDFKNFLEAGENIELTVKCCKENRTKTCYGKDCLMCGGVEVSCAKVVLDLNDPSHCSGEVQILIQIGKHYCMIAGKDNCPCNSSDAHCACCKYPEYKRNCRKTCRCHGICQNLPESIRSKIRGCKRCNNLPACSSSPVPEAIEQKTTTVIPTSDCSQANETNCGNDAFLQDCEDECYCWTVCKPLNQCTGKNGRGFYVWGFCFASFSECCDCTEYPYSVPCPEMCNTTVVESEWYAMKIAKGQALSCSETLCPIEPNNSFNPNCESNK